MTEFGSNASPPSCPLSFELAESPVTQSDEVLLSGPEGSSEVDTQKEFEGYNSLLSRRERFHRFFLDPKDGRAAKNYSLYLDVLVMISLVAFCFESVPQFSTSLRQRGLWFGLESFISFNFLVDFIAKLATQPTWKSYLLTWGSLIDFASILPWGFDVVFQSPLHVALASRKLFSSLRLLRLLRFVRFFKLTVGNFPRISLFVSAVQRSGLAVLFLAIYIFGVGLFFSGCLYYAETSVCRLDKQDAVWVMSNNANEPCSMQNMFDAIWLCLVTMATVGYGDTVPTTPTGKVIASIIMITSMVFLPLPVSIFGANLTELYLEERLARKLDKRRNAHLHAHPEITEALIGNAKGPSAMDNFYVRSAADHCFSFRRDEAKGSTPAPRDRTEFCSVSRDESCPASPTWPAPHPVQIMTMRDTVNLFAMIESLEVTTDEIANEIARVNSKLESVRHQQRHMESLVVEQQIAAHSPEAIGTLEVGEGEGYNYPEAPSQASPRAVIDIESANSPHGRKKHF